MIGSNCLHFTCHIALASIAEVAIATTIRAIPNQLHPFLLLLPLPRPLLRSSLLLHLQLLKLPSTGHHPFHITIEHRLRQHRST